jgi:predicted dehydrogenase
VVSSSTAAFPAQRHILSIIGTDGSVSINGEYDQIVFQGLRRGGDHIDAPPGFAFGDNADPRTFPTLRHRTQLQDITQRIGAGRISAAQGSGESTDSLLQALYLSDAIYRSAAQGREVQLAELR